MKKILIIGGSGYIGSALYFKLNPQYLVDTVDIAWFGNYANINNIMVDYKNLDKWFVNNYDVIILLAGHSSVKMCEGDLLNSHKNNVDNFIELVDKISPGKKFIYASSSSVYGKCTTVADENYMDFVPYNNYDITKHIIDLYIQRMDIEYYGLRFGTVNGWSPAVRKDVMINSMYSSAVTDGEIKLYIKNIMRPILGINDLMNAIEHIVDSDEDFRGIYNLASFNKTAEEIAYGVSEIMEVPVKEYETKPDEKIINSKLQTVCYDFAIDTTKFENTYAFKFVDTIETIVDSLDSKPYAETLRNYEFYYR